MRVPIDAEVICSDGLWGHSSCVIINPINKDITNFVVREKRVAQNERLVPVGLIAETTPNSIVLYCSKEELENLPAFIKKQFVRKSIPQYNLPGDNQDYMLWPLVTYQTVEKAEEHIPLGELTFHRGAVVEARDGQVGEVDEFIVETGGKHITHIVLDEAHFLGNQHVMIPVADIKRIEKDKVLLNLTKEDIKRLPHYRHAI